MPASTSLHCEWDEARPRETLFILLRTFMISTCLRSMARCLSAFLYEFMINAEGRMYRDVIGRWPTRRAILFDQVEA